MPKAILQEEINTMLAERVIEDCESAYAAPRVLVPKKDVCIDFRKQCVYVCIDLLHMKRKTTFISSIDLKSGYWQVRVQQENRDITAFITPSGTFTFTKIPFGLRNALSMFQRLINRFRIGLPEVVILDYLDDLVIASESFESHLRDLETVFERLNLFNLRANRKKCYLERRELKNLPRQKKLLICDRPPPTDINSLLSWLQTGSWFRRFVPNFAVVM